MSGYDTNAETSFCLMSRAFMWNVVNAGKEYLERKGNIMMKEI